MAKLNIKDLEIGDKVFHASTSRVAMIVIDLDIDRNQVTCRWINENKETQTQSFIPQELVKQESFNFGIYAGGSKRNKWEY